MQQTPVEDVSFDPKMHLPSPVTKEGGRGEGVRREDLGPDLPQKIALLLENPGGATEDSGVKSPAPKSPVLRPKKVEREENEVLIRQLMQQITMLTAEVKRLKETRPEVGTLESRVTTSLEYGENAVAPLVPAGLKNWNRPPRPFEGTGVREWLGQIEAYYHDRGFSDRERLGNIQEHLAGEALQFWSTLLFRQGDPPTTWREFRHIMLAQYAGATGTEVLRKLRQVRWEGCLNRFSTEFATVLSSGDPVDPILVSKIYVARLPEEIFEKMAVVQFPDWTLAREAAKMVLNERYERAEVRRCEAPRDEWGRILIPRMNGHVLAPPGQEGASIVARSAVERAPRSPERDGDRGCRMCLGQGHFARDCPNQDSDRRKPGQACYKCKGVGHLGRDCSTPDSEKGRDRSVRPGPRHPQSGKPGNGRA